MKHVPRMPTCLFHDAGLNLPPAICEAMQDELTMWRMTVGIFCVSPDPNHSQQVFIVWMRGKGDTLTAEAVRSDFAHTHIARATVQKVLVEWNSKAG